ncbi:atpB [Symbiodinium microadriaticum]|nr:atpB [Symbiodinium microadriaticum]
MHQFEISRILELQIAGFDVSFTNSSAWMMVTVIAASLFLTLSVRSRALVPGKAQMIAEIAYEFVAGMMRDTVGNDGQKFFPFVFTLFIFILACNMFGMLPYSFTPTSHIIVTFAMAAFVFVGVTLIGIFKHGFRFLSLFVPSGVPMALLPIIIVIEVISYLSRPISLSVRLFANMMAGHTMLKVFAGFIVGMGFVTGGFVPFLFAVALTGLEILVAFLQAYVFAVLTCIYLNDALHLHDH